MIDEKQLKQDVNETAAKMQLLFSGLKSKYPQVSMELIQCESHTSDGRPFIWFDIEAKLILTPKN